VNLPSMNRKTIVWAMALVVIVPFVFGLGYWLWWDQVARFQPHDIKRDQEAFQSLLDRSGAASPNLTGPSITIVTHRDCKPCRLFEETEAKDLRAQGVNTRIIVIAPADDQGLSQSTPIERTTVAEIWWTRDFALYQKWFETPDSQWKPETIPSADNDLARTAVVNAGRLFISEIGTILRTNGVRMTYPLVIWRDKSNRLRVCTCTDKRSFAAIRQDLGIAPRNELLEEFRSVERATQKAAQDFDWKSLDPRQWFAKPNAQADTEAPAVAVTQSPIQEPGMDETSSRSEALTPTNGTNPSIAHSAATQAKDANAVKQSPQALKSDPEWAYPEAEPVYGPE